MEHSRCFACFAYENLIDVAMTGRQTLWSLVSFDKIWQELKTVSALVEAILEQTTSNIN